MNFRCNTFGEDRRVAQMPLRCIPVYGDSWQPGQSHSANTSYGDIYIYTYIYIYIKDRMGWSREAATLVRSLGAAAGFI